MFIGVCSQLIGVQSDIHRAVVALLLVKSSPLYAAPHRLRRNAQYLGGLVNGETSFYRSIKRRCIGVRLHLIGSLNDPKLLVQGGSDRPLDMVSASGVGYKKVAVKRWFRSLRAAEPCTFCV